MHSHNMVILVRTANSLQLVTTPVVCILHFSFGPASGVKIGVKSFGPASGVKKSWVGFSG